MLLIPYPGHRLSSARHGYGTDASAPRFLANTAYAFDFERLMNGRKSRQHAGRGDPAKKAGLGLKRVVLSAATRGSEKQGDRFVP